MKLYSFFNEYIPICWFFLWRDLLEIALFSISFSYLFYWLSQDKTKNLIPYVYMYGGLIGAAYFLQLPTVLPGLLFLAPIICTFFFLVHQKTLQRNFIACSALNQIHTPSPTLWSQELIRACVKYIYQHEFVMCIIEGIDSLEPYLSCQQELHAPIQQDLLYLLLCHQNRHYALPILMCAGGMCGGLNVVWHEQEASILHTNHAHVPAQAVTITQTTDALFFVMYMHDNQPLSTVVHKGIITPSVSLHNLAVIMQKNSAGQQKHTHKKGEKYDHPFSKNDTYVSHSRMP